MKILAQVVSVEPLALIVSMPNQLFAHVPITHISSELTERLEKMGEDDEEDSEDEETEEAGSARVPDLVELFKPGQYVRAVVTTVHAPGSTDVSGLGRARDDVLKASRRVELSIVPEKVNGGVAKADVRPGFVSLESLSLIVNHFNGRCRRWLRLSRVLKIMAISSILGCLRYLASSPSKMLQNAIHKTAKSCMSVNYSTSVLQKWQGMAERVM